MNIILRHIIVYSLFLASPAILNAQVLARASADRDKILIGEPIVLTLEAHVPLGQTITWFILDSIPHFEYLDKGRVDTTEGIDGKQIQQVLKITSFDSGHWQIPALALKVDNKIYSTDTVGIDVNYSPFNPVEDYHDIKEIVEVSQPWWIKYIPWAVGLVTLIAIGVIVWLLTSKKKEVVEEAPVITSKLSPYDDAMLALEELRKKGWILNGEVKTYYSKLNDILRVFILRKLNIATLEKTNEELIQQLQKLAINRESYQQLSTALRMADFVKFAKYEPGSADNEKNFMIIHAAITTLNNIQ